MQAIKEHQLDLFQPPKARRSGVRGIVRLPKPRLTLRQKAEAWVEKYPGGFALFEELARKRVAIQKPFGAKALAEAVRWELAFRAGPEEEFAVNNSYVSYIARLLIERHPEWEKYIEFRKVRS